jgi:DNA-binding MarR family transcriptional regulator
MDKAKVSRAVAGLAGRRLLRHVAHKGDRRLDPLALTPAGRAVFEAIVPRARALEADLAAALPEDARAALEAGLRAIAARAAAMGAEAEGGPD